MGKLPLMAMVLFASGGVGSAAWATEGDSRASTANPSGAPHAADHLFPPGPPLIITNPWGMNGWYGSRTNISVPIGNVPQVSPAGASPRSTSKIIVNPWGAAPARNISVPIEDVSQASRQSGKRVPE
jgi:hypothetical protein